MFDLQGVGHISFTRSYNTWLYRRKKDVLDSVFRGRDLAGFEVCDVGCGVGVFVEWYLGRGSNVRGIDITDKSILELSKRYRQRAEFVRQDITDCHYRSDREFDIVNMWDVIYHIVDDVLFVQALENVRQSLKKGGLFLFTDWFGMSSDKQLAPHVKARSLATYQALLPGKGLRLVEVRPLYRWLDVVHLTYQVDSRLGWLYYILDSVSPRGAKENVSLSVWRMEGS